MGALATADLAYKYGSKLFKKIVPSRDASTRRETGETTLNKIDQIRSRPLLRESAKSIIALLDPAFRQILVVDRDPLNPTNLNRLVSCPQQYAYKKI